MKTKEELSEEIKTCLKQASLAFQDIIFEDEAPEGAYLFINKRFLLTKTYKQSLETAAFSTIIEIVNDPNVFVHFLISKATVALTDVTIDGYVCSFTVTYGFPPRPHL